MRKTVFVILAMALVPFCALGDGTVLINQSTVMAAGGDIFTSGSGCTRDNNAPQP